MAETLETKVLASIILGQGQDTELFSGFSGCFLSIRGSPFNHCLFQLFDFIAQTERKTLGQFLNSYDVIKVVTGSHDFANKKMNVKISRRY